MNKSYNPTLAKNDAVALFNQMIKEQDAYIDRDTYTMCVNQIRLQPSVIKEGLEVTSLINAYKELNRLKLLQNDKREFFTIFPYVVKDKVYAMTMLRPLAIPYLTGGMVQVESVNSKYPLYSKPDGTPVYDLDAIKVSLVRDGKVLANETYETSFLFIDNIAKYSDAYKETLSLPENKMRKDKITKLLEKVDKEAKAHKGTPNFVPFRVLNDAELVEFCKRFENYSKNDASQNRALRLQTLVVNAQKHFLNNRLKNGKCLGVKQYPAFVEGMDNALLGKGAMERLNDALLLDYAVVVQPCDKNNQPLKDRVEYINNRDKRGEIGKPINFTDNLSNVSLFEKDGKISPKFINKKIKKENLLFR